MILDRIENADLYTSLNPKIAKGIEYIKSTDLVSLASGKYDISEGLRAIISEYNTKNIEDCRLESHRKYIDIQYIISVEELIGFAPLKNQPPSIAYNETKDVIFYEDDEVSYTKLETGMFAIYYPTDLHRPCVKNKTSSPVKKLVIKVLA